MVITIYIEKEVIDMNVTSLVSNRYIEIENRKRALRQKTADDAYRKNAQYFKPQFNPAIEEIVDLLTGKKEKEHQPEVQAAIRSLKQQKNEAKEEKSNSIVHSEVPSSKNFHEDNAQTIAILEDVRDAALAPENPSEQDLKVAATADEIIQKTQGQSNIIQLDKPEKAEKDSKIDHALKERLFNKAISFYTFHMQMAKQGFEFAQPTFYRAV